MTNAQILLTAGERLAAAETELRLARMLLHTLEPGAPLRDGVAATRRLRAAEAELEAAGLAYEAAQDLPAPQA